MAPPQAHRSPVYSASRARQRLVPQRDRTATRSCRRPGIVRAAPARRAGFKTELERSKVKERLKERGSGVRVQP